MSTIEVILLLCAEGLLVGYLYARHRQRVRDRLVRTLDEAQWTGVAIDVTALRPRLERVRSDYAMHPRPHDSGYRAGLLALARQALSGFGYFRDKAQDHGTEPKSCV